MGTNKIPGKIITVIGGGPSGMTAAICAARQGAKTVRLIEKNSMPGRKLLATGNGRCNLTNIRCSDAEKTLGFFAELGILTRTEEEGRVYPYSEQASAVQEALIEELKERKVEVLCGIDVKAVEQIDTGFRIVTEKGSFDTDAVILATGGKAGPQYGSLGDGYRFAKAFGHHVVRLMPSLVQMVSDRPFFKDVKGVRAKGQASLIREGTVIDCETGEIQFTEDGLSGICIFNLSRNYVKEDWIRLDLFPGYREGQLIQLLQERSIMLGSRTMAQYFNGILPKKLIPVILAELSLEENSRAATLDPDAACKMAKLLKGWDIPITGTKGWKEAQVTSGGIDLAEVDPETMESKLVPNLYFAGELLNVDEKCGGFNLQWAWTSGLKAGSAAAIKEK